MHMKTQLKPISSRLAAVLGNNNSQDRYISIPDLAPPESRAPKPQTTLAQIDAALDRLELGTFGLCDRCGDEICVTRLDADPCVRSCQGCEDTATAL